MMNVIEYYTAPIAIAPEVQPKTLKKIETFSDLPAGWHYGKGRAASVSTVSRAKDIFTQYVQVGFLTTDAFPGKDGEIMITGYKDNFYVECTVENNGRYSVIGEKDKALIVESTYANEGQAIDAITQVALRAWNTFVSYTLNISTQGEMNSKASHLKTLQMTGQLQYYYANASVGVVKVGAPTSGATTYRME
jgi:hypothetical protein